MWFDKTALSYAHWRAGRPAVKNHQLLAGLSTDGFWDIQSFNVIEETLHFYQHSIFACKIEMGKSLSHFCISNGRTASQGNLRENGFVWACGSRGIRWARHGSRQGRHDGRSRRPAGHTATHLWNLKDAGSRAGPSSLKAHPSEPLLPVRPPEGRLHNVPSVSSQGHFIFKPQQSAREVWCRPRETGCKGISSTSGLAPVWRASSLDG